MLKTEGQPISASIVTLISFLLITPTELYTNIPQEWLGYTGLFAALILTWLVVKLMQFMYEKKIYIHMPEGVPSIIEDAFASLVPAIVVVILSVVLAKLVALTSFENVHQVIYTLIQTPLQGFGLSLPAYLTMQIVCTLLMFCGIHGNTVFSLYTPITMAASVENLAALSAGEPCLTLSPALSPFCVSQVVLAAPLVWHSCWPLLPNQNA